MGRKMRMRPQLAVPIRIVLVVLAFAMCITGDANGDQVGIDKVRLFETSPGRYVLEVDTTPRFIAVYREPVLPPRFELTESVRERQSGYFAMRYQFESSGKGLTSDDELLLPWGRSGASITAQWSDGSVHQNLFLRDFEGIRVPIAMLKPKRSSTRELIQQYANLGATHAFESWNHWLLVAAAGLLASGWSRVRLIVWFAAGQGLSLLAADLGLFVVPSEVAEICVMVAALLIARTSPLEPDQWNRFLSVMLILGALHGTANAEMLADSGVPKSDLIQALFAFNIATDLFQLGATLIIAAIAVVIQQRTRLTNNVGWPLRVAIGSCAVAMSLVALTGGLPSTTQIASERQVGPFELPGEQITPQGSQAQPPRTFEQSLATFLTIEPFETRLEVLVRFANANNRIEFSTDLTTIPIDEQEKTTGQLVNLIEESTRLFINGDAVSPSIKQANFVSVEPNGVFSRPSPVLEQVADAIVGVTFIYDTANMPNHVQLSWDLFLNGEAAIPATVVDPFGAKQSQLSSDKSQVDWQNRWSGYRPPSIKPVEISKPQLPLLSLMLVLVACGVNWSLGSRSDRLKSTATTTLLAIAMVAYPFARTSLGVPFATTWKPSTEETSEIQRRLLTNVYRAYDMRDEEAIYDRLALTVSGEQLTEIYLDTRRSLELENRGGARAKVDEVQIEKVHSIEHDKGGGYAVDVEWTVSGSVSHFGHTHYRRNRYRAVVTMMESDQFWKIRSLQVVQQQRLL